MDDPGLPDLGPALDLMRTIWALDHRLEQVSRLMQREIGITAQQRFVLRALGRRPGLSAGDLARLLHVHPSSLTAMLARLEKNGLIRRRLHEDDRRRQVLTLTTEGRRFDRLRRRTVEAAAQMVVHQMRASDLQRAKRVLGQLAAAMDAWL